MPKLSLIIATFNRAQQLTVTLQSLVGQTAPIGTWECIVVDNNSTDNTAEIFSQFAAQHPSLDIRMVRETRQGLSHARNRGIAESKGDYIAIIDDDEYVNPDFIQAYIHFFDSNADCPVAGGRVIAEYPSGVRPKQVSHYIEQALANPMHYGDAVRPFPAGKIPAGGNMAFRRETLLRYDGFNISLGRTGKQLTGGEESDLFERMKADGIVFFYVPNAVIRHVIPPAKLTIEYIRRLAFGTGISQYRRAKLHNRTAALYLGEFAKWIATLGLGAMYTLTFRPSKARWLFAMRWHTTRGIIKKE